MHSQKTNSDHNDDLHIVQKITRILNNFDSDILVISEAYDDRGTDYLNPRLYRAAINQLDAPSGDAMASRYGIWGNTVRDHIIDGLEFIENGNVDAAKVLLIKAANSLSAFSEIQALADPLRIKSRYGFRPGSSQK